MTQFYVITTKIIVVTKSKLDREKGTDLFGTQIILFVSM